MPRQGAGLRVATSLEYQSSSTLQATLQGHEGDTELLHVQSTACILRLMQQVYVNPDSLNCACVTWRGYMAALRAARSTQMKEESQRQNSSRRQGSTAS